MWYQVQNPQMDKYTKPIKSRTSIKDTSLGDLSCHVSCKASMIECVHD